MKHLFTSALLLGATVLSSLGQSIVITDKDGLKHKFNADYVQEITFEKIGTGIDDEINFTSLNVNPYGKKNIELAFSGENAEVSLDIYQPEAYYLQTGTYTVDSSYGDYTIDPGYSKVILNSEEETLKAGKMEISADGDIYTIVLDMTLASGKALKGKYEGSLNKFNKVINYDLSGCQYVEVNDPEANGFYYRFNDADWKLEMRIDLFSDGAAPAPGTYSFSSSTENGSASSYVSLYSPYNETCEFTEGTVTVSGEGDNTVVEIEGMLSFGMEMKAKYTGALPARPVPAEESTVFSALNVYAYGPTNLELTFSNDTDKVALDLYQPSAFFLQPGTYTVAGSGDYTIGIEWSKIELNSVEEKLKSGSVEVSEKDNVYSFKMDLVMESGKELKAEYEGQLNNYGKVVNYDLVSCVYVSVNDPAANGFYYRFSDDKYRIEARIDFFSDGDVPAAGTYKFGDSTTNGSAQSNLDLYSYQGQNSISFTEGTVTISGEGDDTVVEIEGMLPFGVEMKAKYTGALPARK